MLAIEPNLTSLGYRVQWSNPQAHEWLLSWRYCWRDRGKCHFRMGAGANTVIQSVIHSIYLQRTQLVDNAAECPDVWLVRIRFALADLRTVRTNTLRLSVEEWGSTVIPHVERGSNECLSDGISVDECLWHTEVADLNAAFPREEHVWWLDISMEDLLGVDVL